MDSSTIREHGAFCHLEFLFTERGMDPSRGASEQLSEEGFA
jgi:hypothetical protein